MERLKDEWIKHKINYIKVKNRIQSTIMRQSVQLKTSDKAKSAASNFFSQIRGIFLNARDSLEERN